MIDVLLLDVEINVVVARVGPLAAVTLTSLRSSVLHSYILGVRLVISPMSSYRLAVRTVLLSGIGCRMALQEWGRRGLCGCIRRTCRACYSRRLRVASDIGLGFRLCWA